MRELFMIMATALLSSTLTLGAAWWLWRNHLQTAVKASLAEEIDALGEVVESRVRAGVLDAVSSIPSRDVIAETTRNVTRTGASLLEEGLGSLLRPGRRKD